MTESTINEAIKIAVEALIKPFEGYHKRLPNGDCIAYPDPASPRASWSPKSGKPPPSGDPWTIGYGSTGPDIKEGTVWTHEQAEEALINHVIYFTEGVLALSPELVTEPPRRLAAIISFAYNCGLGNYRISTLRKRINEKNWEEAYDEILKWNKARGRVMSGLTRRREAEGALLL